MRPAPVLSLALVLFAPAARSAPGQDGQRESLEQLLERARQQQELVQAKLKGDVEAIVKELEAAPPPRKLAELGERLVALGSEATPLLVSHIDPGDGATEREKLRSLQVALALARMDTTAVTSELIELLKSGNNDATRNALRVLPTNPQPARTVPAIQSLFQSSQGGVKQAALSALITIGGPDVEQLLGEVLSGSDENLIALALQGLTRAPSASALTQVRRILAQPASAARHALPLLGYFLADPRSATDADVQAFLRVAQQATVPQETRIAVLEGLAQLGPSANAEFKRQMEPIVGAADRKLREAGLVLLARLGDKSSRRELTREYDDLVDKNERWAEAYVRRGDIYARIDDDDEAIKNFKEALVVGRNDPTLQPDTWEKLARAYARKGRLKDAAETLNKSTLSRARLRELADDPEFKSLRDSKYAKDAFGISD